MAIEKPFCRLYLHPMSYETFAKILRCLVPFLLLCTLLNMGSRDAVAADWQTQSVSVVVLSQAASAEPHTEPDANDLRHKATDTALVKHLSAPGSKVSHSQPATYPAQLPSQSRLTHPSYFLHPDQQPDYELLYVFADPDLYRVSQQYVHQPLTRPWHQCATRARTGLINDCQPANLTYRARLTYQLSA
ncbi:hypothetical protein [Pseudoalteromonas rubra]|nr:hypothetical protein [Pseudoalteromonas rubra]